jgi:hypothetical protein
MLITALFTVAKQRNKPRCPNNQWMDKENVACVHTEYYLAIKKNEIMSFAET